MPFDVLDENEGWISDPRDELAGYQTIITVEKQIEKPRCGITE